MDNKGGSTNRGEHSVFCKIAVREPNHFEGEKIGDVIHCAKTCRVVISSEMEKGRRSRSFRLLIKEWPAGSESQNFN